LWPPHAILVSDWLISKKSSPLKLLSHMNRNLVGSIYMYGIDASYQVSVHLAKRFQRRRFLKIGHQKQELLMAAMFVDGSGQNEQSLERTFH
jgi:hypothetical protein